MEKHKEMFKLVVQWQESGMSQIQFCRTHNLKIHCLRYWVRKKREEESLSGFRLIEPERNRSGISVVYPNGVKIEAPSDSVLIRELIHLY